VSWLIRIDVHDLGCSAFVRETDMNRDFHPYAQGNSGHNQGTMEVDDECLAFAHQRFVDTMSLDPNFQTNPSALSRFTINLRRDNTSPAQSSLITGINKVSDTR
jgi:hypothetical protein